MRGVQFDEDGTLLGIFPTEECHRTAIRALEDVAEFLGFAGYMEYLKALKKERARIFARMPAKKGKLHEKKAL